MTQAKYMQIFTQIDKHNIFIYVKRIIQKQEIVKRHHILHARKNFQQHWKVQVEIIFYISIYS